MPKEFSRIRCRRTDDLRVEWLSEITCEDIRAEGVTCTLHGRGCTGECAVQRAQWFQGWDEINGARAPAAETPPGDRGEL